MGCSTLAVGRAMGRRPGRPGRRCRRQPGIVRHCRVVGTRAAPRTSFLIDPAVGAGIRPGCESLGHEALLSCHCRKLRALRGLGLCASRGGLIGNACSVASASLGGEGGPVLRKLGSVSSPAISSEPPRAGLAEIMVSSCLGDHTPCCWLQIRGPAYFGRTMPAVSTR